MDDYAYSEKAAPVSELQIDKYVVRIDKTLLEQQDLIRQLCARLEMVTLPERDDETVRPEPEELLVPMAGHLRSIEGIIIRHNRRVSELMERLQL